MKVSDDPGVVGLRWWLAIFGRDDGPARKARAVLRSASTPLDVLVVPESHVLNHRWRDQGIHATPGQLAAVATVLAHVQRDGKRPLAAVFGEHVDGASRPRLSQKRFDSLVRTQLHDELQMRLRRAIACIGNSHVSVEQLARDVYRWGPAVAGRWCYQYYGEYSSSEQDTSVHVSMETTE